MAGLSPLDAFLGIIAAVTLALIIKNMRSSGELRIPFSVKAGRSELEIVIDGKVYKGFVYRAEAPPRLEENLAERLASLTRSMRVSVTFVSNMFKIDRSRILRFIDEELKKAELAYTATKHVKYAERIKFLRGLYRDVLRHYTPYTGSFSFIVWIPADEQEAERLAEAFKSLVEVETGVKVVRAQFNGIDALVGLSSINDVSPPKPLILSSTELESRGIILGPLDDESGIIVTLDWPSDFEAHVGIFGPTGKGKTVLLAGIAAQLSMLSATRLDPYMVVVIDPKGDLLELVKGVVDEVKTVNSGDCIPLPRLEGLGEELVRSSMETGSLNSSVRPCKGSLVRRGSIAFNLSGLKNEDRNVAASLILSSIVLEASEVGLPGRVAFIIDEAWRISVGSSKHFILAAREGRSKGLHLVYATQSPQDMHHSIVDNTKTIIVFGGYTEGYLESVRRLGLDNPKDLLKLPTGTALVKIGDRPPVRVRVLDYKGLLNRLA